MAAESISPTKPTRPGYANCLHPKMIKALGRFGWDEAAERETRERHKMLQAWELEQGLEVHSDECPGAGSGKEQQGG